MAIPNVISTNAVVPLAAIIDQLKGKLTEAEIDALLFAVLSKRTAQVQPGDLITAELINQILTDIAALNVRVAALQTGQPPQGQTPVVIVYPTASTELRIGDPLVVQGQNLLPNSTVLIENTAVSGIIGSGDNTRLTIPQIPSISLQGGLPDAGRQVRLTVINGAGQNATVFVLKPAASLRLFGTIIIAQSSGPAAGTQFVKGGSYNYAFRITADTRPDETFLVSASIGRSGWTTSLSQTEIFIPAAPNAQTPSISTVSVTVNIDHNAQDNDTGTLVVTLTSKHDSAFEFSSVGIPIEVSSTATATRKLNLALSQLTAGQAAIRIADNTPLIGPAGGAGGSGQINFTVTRVDGVSVNGDYLVDLTKLAALLGDTTPPRWQARLAGTSGNRVTLAGATPSVGIELTAAAGAPNARLVIELTKENDSTVSGYLEQPVERRQ